MRRARLSLLAPPLLALLAGCGGPDYYLLPSEAAPARAAASRASVSVADIDLPAYAGALEIAKLGEGGAVRLETGALWADTPQRALTRHLVSALSSRLGGLVAADPWPAFDPPALQLRVIVDEMIGAPDAELDFAGQFFLVNASGRVVASDRFRFAVAPRGAGYPGLLASHARAIEELADQVAARVSARPGA